MKIFFDCEFTGLHKDTTLISIGMVTEDETSFYAEFTDYDKDQVNNWIKENVIDNLIISDLNSCARIKPLAAPPVSMTCKGCKEDIREWIIHWLGQFNDIEFISDVCHYDMVLLIDLLADSALDIPENISCACYDINQDISNFYKCSQKDAFNMSREKILKDFYSDNDYRVKHNALYDAYTIKNIYDGIKNFNK